MTFNLKTMTTELTSPHHTGAIAALDTLGLLKFAANDALAVYDPLYAAFQKFKAGGGTAAKAVSDASKEKALNWWERIPPNVRAGLLVGVPSGVAMGVGVSQLKDPLDGYKKRGWKGWVSGGIAGAGLGVMAGSRRSSFMKSTERMLEQAKQVVDEGIPVGAGDLIPRLKHQIKGWGDIVDSVKAKVPDVSWDVDKVKNFNDNPRFRSTLGGEHLTKPGEVEYRAIMQAYRNGLKGEGVYEEKASDAVEKLISSIRSTHPDLSAKQLAGKLHPDRLVDTSVEPQVVLDAYARLVAESRSGLGGGVAPQYSRPDAYVDAARDVGLEHRKNRVGAYAALKNEANKTFTSPERINKLRDTL